MLKVCLVHAGGVTPIRGGGIGSVISNVVKVTQEKIEYTIMTGFNEQDLLEARKIYPSSVRIVSIRFSDNIAFDFMKYFAKSPHVEFDVVHFHDFPMGRELSYAIKAYASKCKLVYSYHLGNEFFAVNNLIARGAYYFLFNRLCRVWKRIIVNSKFMLDDMKRFGDYTDKIVTIPNGVNIEEIQKTPRIDLPGDPSFFFVGHLEYRKGVDILLEAFRIVQRQVKGAYLHLVGSGSMKNYCTAYVVKNQLRNVCFWGAATEHLKCCLLRSSDICVFPSRYEPFGIILLEAMAAGKPIISTKVGGIPEIVIHQRNGLLVEPERGQLAQAMKLLCGRKDLVEKFSENNLRDVERYSWRAIAQEYIRLYDSVVNGVQTRGLLTQELHGSSTEK